MEILYCPNCGKKIGFKRSLGFGTFFAVLATGGLWLLAIAAYPLRCVGCGGTDVGSQSSEKNSNEIHKHQTWVEEFVYKFDKAVTRVSSSPGDPVTDYSSLATFFDTIKAESLDTSRISGFEQKEKFERLLLKAQNLLDKLEKPPQVQEYLRKQEEARLEKKRLEAAALNAALKKEANERKIIIIGVLFAVASVIIVATVYEEIRKSNSREMDRSFERADVNIQSKVYETAKKKRGYLTQAAFRGDVGEVKRLLNEGYDVNGMDERSRTALMDASFKSQLEVVKLLIDKGVDVNAKDNYGYTALKLASQKGNLEVVTILKAHGSKE